MSSLTNTGNRHHLVALRHQVMLSGSPVYISPTETFTFTIEWPWASTLTNYTATMYIKNGSDVSATYMTGGSHSAAGNVQTLKSITLVVGGVRYVVNVTATIDGGNTETRMFEIIARKAQDGM
jgi:hypothetical protein